MNLRYKKNTFLTEPPQPPKHVGVTGITSHSAKVEWTLAQPATVLIQYYGEGASVLMLGQISVDVGVNQC